MSDTLFREQSPTQEVIAARLALTLHKTPDEIRHMSMEDVDAVLYLIRCDNHKQQEEAKVQEEMSKLK